MRDLCADVIIIGSGAGGGTMAYALKNGGAKVLLLNAATSYPLRRRTGQRTIRSSSRATSRPNTGSTTAGSTADRITTTSGA